MPWLKVRYTLDSDARVAKEARACGVELDHFIGKLIRFWCYVSRFSREGWLPDKTSPMIDLMFGLGGFTQSLKNLGWVKELYTSGKKGIQVCNWDDHLSTKAKHEAIKELDEMAAAPLFANDPAPATSKSKKPKGIKDVFPGFDLFWHVWPYKAGKIDAQHAWNKLEPDMELVGVIVKAVKEQCSWPRWIRDNGQYIPLPATWLNGSRWNDLPAHSAAQMLEHTAEEKRIKDLEETRAAARLAERRRTRRGVKPPRGPAKEKEINAPLPKLTAEMKQALMPEVKPPNPEEDKALCEDLEGFYEAYLEDHTDE